MSALSTIVDHINSISTTLFFLEGHIARLQAERDAAFLRLDQLLLKLPVDQAAQAVGALAGLGVVRSGDFGRHRAHWADGPRLQLVFGISMASLELLATATPTRIIRLQHRMSLRVVRTGATGRGRQP